MYKFITAFLFLVHSLSSSFSQEPTIKEMDDDNLVKIINNFKLIAKKKTARISVRVLELFNEPGSAGGPSGEVTSYLLIAVSEFGEYPSQKLFRLGDLHNPKIKFEELYRNVEDIDGTNVHLTVSHGSHDKVTSTKLTINMTGLTFR